MHSVRIIVPSVYHPDCYPTVTTMLLQVENPKFKCEVCLETPDPEAEVGEEDSRPQQDQNNKDDTPLSREEAVALHEQATKLRSDIDSSPPYSVLGGWLVVFHFGLNVNVFVHVMEGGDISIGRQCCKEGNSYKVPQHTAGFAFRAGLGDAHTVNYDRKHGTKYDVVAVVMSEYANGAKKGPTHCAPVHPDGNAPSAVLIFAMEIKGVLREQGAIKVAKEVLGATNSKMVDEVNNFYNAIQNFCKANEEHGKVLMAFAKTLGYFPLGLNKTRKATGFPNNLHQMGIKDSRIREAYNAFDGFLSTSSTSKGLFDFLGGRSKGLSRLHFYDRTVSTKGMPWHRDNYASHISGWWFRVPLSFFCNRVLIYIV